MRKKFYHYNKEEIRRNRSRKMTGLYYNIVCNSAGQCAVDTKCICIYRDTKRCCKYVRAFNGRCGDL